MGDLDNPAGTDVAPPEPQQLTQEQIQQQNANIEAQKAAQAAERVEQGAAAAKKDGDPNDIDFDAADKPESPTETGAPVKTENLVDTHKRGFAKASTLLKERKWLEAGLALWSVATDAFADFQDYLAQSLANTSKAPQFLIDMVGQEKYSFQKMFKNVQVLGIAIINPDGSPVTRLKSEPFMEIYAAKPNIKLQTYVDALQVKIQESGETTVTEKQLYNIAKEVMNEMKPEAPVVEPPVAEAAPATTPGTPATTPAGTPAAATTAEPAATA